MTKFYANDPLVVVLNTEPRIRIPGIAVADSYMGTRTDSNGHKVPAEYVEAITFHDIPATDTTPRRVFHKQQTQSAFFTQPRTEPVPEIDDLTAEELIAKVAESVEEFQSRLSANRAAQRANAPKTKADFTQLALPASK